MNENFIKNYEYYKDISLKKYNTYRLDVKCGYLIYPGTVEELTNLLKYLKENNINYFILGGGSNIILAKPYFDVVIKLDKLNNIEIKDNIVTAEAGVSLIYLSNLCMNNNLNGLAFAGGIPGMVGASTAMNAGAYKEDMASIVKEVKVVTPELEVITLTNKDLNYSYRNSFLKEHKDYICTEVTLEMSYLDKDKIKETMTSRKKRRIDTQPLDKPSAGSVFRNPEGLSAGKLIEDAGLKGYKIGGAKISTKHANFIVNTGDATYEDILELIDYTKKKIKEIYNIDLILEQEIIR
jgi:UDP-N-acetylmuramate dehydrogenase